ncbi:reverse transcriptase domain-containing protein [Tanacetum coccineum]
MKKLVQSLPTLTAPRVGETLTMHLVAAKESISVVLAAERYKGWTPIYFISRVLQGAELNYPALEKLVLALVQAARRLRRYFQAHTITILTNTPPKKQEEYPSKITRRNKNQRKYQIQAVSEDSTLTEPPTQMDQGRVNVDRSQRNQNKKADALTPPQTDEIIKEIHEGSCGFNTEPRSLVFRITKQRFYWPSMHREIAKAIQDCKKCKEQFAVRKAKTSGAIAAGSTWPFSHWGIHIIGPLPVAPGGL